MRWHTAVALALGFGAFSLAMADPGEVADAAAMPVRRARWLMGTRCMGEAYGAGAAQALGRAFDVIAQAEAMLSTWRDDSELSRLNRAAAGGPATASPELWRFLAASLHWAEASGGAFDPTVGPLMAAWDLRGPGRIPADDELAQARAAVGAAKVLLDGEAGTVRFTSPGLWIDSGGIGKGWALDRAGEALRHEVDAALLDFGGQMLAVGVPSGADGWSVAVARPDDRMRPALLLRLRSGSVATSAQSERGAEVAGRWLGHIVDPRTGAPVPRAGSVTVIAPTATEADALSTALFVMGPDQGLAWAEGRDGLAVGYLEPAGGRRDEPQLRLRANRRFRSLMIASPQRLGAEPLPPPPGPNMEDGR